MFNTFSGLGGVGFSQSCLKKGKSVIRVKRVPFVLKCINVFGVCVSLFLRV